MIYQRPSSNHTRDRDIANMPLYVDSETHKPFWRYVVAMVLFMAFVLGIGNLIEVIAP